MSNRYNIWLFLAVISMISCLPESEAEIIIDEELVFYFDTFKTEAAKRGITVDYQEVGLGGMIKDLSSEGILGQCVHDNLNPDLVIIDNAFWQSSNNMHREFIVFHELGHCFLDRGHDDSKDANGKCASIMNSGSAQCRANYTTESRNAYLDELFNI